MSGTKRQVRRVESSASTARLGRRPGVSHTREAIIDAARVEFAAKGYDRTTFRAVATRAEVDPMLLVHYFKNKDGLFRAAMALPDGLADRWAAVIDGPIETLGHDLAVFYLSLWDSPDTSAQLRAVLTSAASNENAAAIMREVLADELLSRLAARLPGRDASSRAGLIAGHLVGVALMRYVLAIPDMARPATTTLVSRLGPTLQNYVEPSA